jgi:hypothetical protein
MAQKYNSIPQITAAEAASGIAPTSETQWSWIGDGDKPCLCDQKVDNFYAVWPEGSDASGISQTDVSVTLYSQYEISRSSELMTIRSLPQLKRHRLPLRMSTGQ